MSRAARTVLFLDLRFAQNARPSRSVSPIGSESPMDKLGSTDTAVPEKTYEKPQIEDHGDLAELTAGLASGHHVDGTFTYGQVPGFISGP
jgi:hypothetical protein